MGQKAQELVNDQDKKYDAKFNKVHNEIKEMKDDFNKRLQALSVNGTEWMGEETTLVAFYTYAPPLPIVMFDVFCFYIFNNNNNNNNNNKSIT